MKLDTSEISAGLHEASQVYEELAVLTSVVSAITCNMLVVSLKFTRSCGPWHPAVGSI